MTIRLSKARRGIGTRFLLGRSEVLTSHRASTVNVAVNEILSTGLRVAKAATSSKTMPTPLCFRVGIPLLVLWCSPCSRLL
jgi:hypothetical protein